MSVLSAAEPTAPEQPPDAGTDQWLGRMVGLLAVSLAALAAFTMMWGWQIDETLSAWVSQDGLGDTIGRAQEYQGNSALYFSLLWLWRHAIGHSEFLLRLPSAVAVGAAAWHMFKLGSSLDREATGWIAAGVLLASANAFTGAITARPYGLLLLLAVWSTRQLLRWIADPDGRAGWVWVVMAAAMLYCSPFAIALIAVHGLVALTNRESLGMNLWRMAGAGAILSLPLVPQQQALAARSSSLVISSQPDFLTAVQDLIPVLVLVVLVVAFFRRDGMADGSALRLAVAWALAPLVFLWAGSAIGGGALWVSRYWIACAPGMALLCGLILGRVDGDVLRRLLFGLVLIVGLVGVAQGLVDQHQGWREASAWVAEETEGEPAVVYVNPSLIETVDPDLTADPSWRAYLTAPVNAYGHGEAVPLIISEHREEAEAFVARLDIDGPDTIALVASPSEDWWPDYDGIFADRLAAAGYRAVRSDDAPWHGMDAVVYRRER